MTRALICILLFALSPLAAQQYTLTDAPRRYLVVNVEGAARDWDVRPIRITNQHGQNLQGANEGDFQPRVDRWERTGLARRYQVGLWRDAFARFTGASSPPGARFYFYAVAPRQPVAEGKLNLVDERRRQFWVPAAAVTIKGYPQTWVDIWEGYVGQFTGERRQQAVKEWEAAHESVIANETNQEGGFTQEERNEFARFYQQQFVFIRDRNPALPAIYDELAAYHMKRGNLDAELSTYLDALRAGVQSPDRERFHLTVGRILVQRLQLYADARPHLQAARNHAQAHYLLAQAHFRMGLATSARETLQDLIRRLRQPGEEPLQLELTMEEELARANLLLAEVEISQNNFAAAEASLGLVAPESTLHEQGRLLYASMLLYRGDNAQGGDKNDAAKVRDTIKALPLWAVAQTFLVPKPDTVYPLSPLMARALVLYAQADPQYRDAAQPGKRPTPDLLRMLNAAKSLDPLSAEPWLAEARLFLHMGLHIDAMNAYTGGLNVNPRDVLLNYGLGDLHFKAGVLSVAKDYFSRALAHEPDFFPALSRLGEAAMLEIESLREVLLIKRNAGEEVDYASELVPYMKEAAAFWGASLAIQPRQPATQLALATLYLQLAELAPLTMAASNDGQEVRRAYLTKSRDLAHALVLRAREYAEAREKALVADPRARAEAPALAAFNTWAFAMYALGDIDGARAAFEEHIAATRRQEFFADTAARSAYQTSTALKYAVEWLRRIDENNRRYFEVVEFEKDSTEGYYNGWEISRQPKSDTGFEGATAMKGGRLHLGVKQAQTGIVSRLEIDKPFSTLAVFEAEFVATGDARMNRGIHLTKLNPASGGSSSSDTPVATIMLGVDDVGRVFYETRRFQLDNQATPEVVVDQTFIDVRSYGGLALAKDEKLRLALRRQLSEDKAVVEYWAVINGYEVKLNVNDNDLKNQEIKTGNAKLKCGFFAYAASGTQAAVAIDRVRFVYDSGLGD